MNQTLVFEPSGFDLQTIPGSGNSDVFVKVSGSASAPQYTIQQKGRGPIDGLGINGNLTTERVNINGSTSNLQVFLGQGNDRLTISGAVNTSSIELGNGRDNSTINGPFVNSGLTSGADRDTIAFRGVVSSGYVDAGAGDDLVNFNGDVSGSVVNLGTGNDQVRFSGDATNTTLNLGTGRDQVRFFDDNAATTGLVIEGASSDDKLFIGSSQYKYVGDYTWENVKDPNDDLRFGPPA